MSSLLLKNVLHEGRKTCILIADGRFKDLNAPQDCPADRVYEADGLAILPAMYNTHTHAAMTLLRGYADDMALNKWLQEYIWPYEDKLTAEDIRRGSEIAIREMLAGGTVFFSDMYFEIEGTMKEVEKYGMRAAIGITMLDGHSLSQQEHKLDTLKHWKDPSGGLLTLTIDPHAIYTAGPETFRKCARLCKETGYMLHTHLSETKEEVENCIKAHGTTPVRYLNELGVLGPHVIAAHCVHVDKEEWKILADNGVTVSHCPASNMKLGSGRFPYELAIESGCRITIGTDGASSNNNLDLRESVKLATLLAKVNGDPELLPAELALRWATRNGAEAFGIDAGEVKEGMLADAILLRMSPERMQPCHNLVSNFIYSADSSCIKATICNGKIVYESDFSMIFAGN